MREDQRPSDWGIFTEAVGWARHPKRDSFRSIIPGWVFPFPLSSGVSRSSNQQPAHS